MDLKSYFDRLSPDEEAAYARRYGAGYDYIRKFLLCKQERRRMPNVKTIRRIIIASEGELNWAIVLAWFYPELRREVGSPMPTTIAPETETNRIEQSQIKSTSARRCATGDQSQRTLVNYGL